MKAKRIAVIDRELCNPKSCGMYLCQRVCPVNRSQKECIVIGPDNKPEINEELCIGCSICAKKCPKEAISIVNLPEKLDETPIHRYGKNMFSLFELPVPKRNAVIGLIGQNGIGKSTILNILSGSLKPNAGKRGTDWKEIVARFKGTELQSYLERLSEKKIRSAYKPQHVDSIPSMYKGKVKDLLEKVNENKKLKEVIDRLGLKEMLDKDIKNLSGGELQLFAIAGTLLKDRDFYFFDEPSSYLDAKERLLIAKEIRRLAERAVVMVIEHDLAVADYLADYVHILYGKPSVFGVVSNTYGVRVGINTYLEGYIKEENIRFRPDPILFMQGPKQSDKNKLFMEFDSFEKKLKDFEMRTEKGELFKGEIIGILGPNSIGKTTFIRMLTGELKSDKGHSFKDLKLAYKPQRLILSKEDESKTVQDYLSEKGKMNTENKRVCSYLGLEKLMERKMKNLSGGELQSVMIAGCLIQEKDILLLDEPSAFLDVEQRLRVAKLLKNHTENLEIPCFIVDHDLLFIDVIADRIMVFDGKPRISGFGHSPCSLEDGMNTFLKNLDVTYRRDPQTGRPRANKPDSQKDMEQKKKGKFYYN